MSETLQRIKALTASGDWKVSNHAADEMEEDDIFPTAVIQTVQSAIVVEDYPHFGKGPAVLVRQVDETGRYIHVVWGIPEKDHRPAVVITAYRPEPSRWSSDFLRRMR